MSNVRGKSVKTIAFDIAEGYVAVNPLFLKPFESETLRELLAQVTKVQTEIRGEKFPFNDTTAIRSRNMKLQRLHTALIIIRNYARDKRIPIV